MGAGIWISPILLCCIWDQSGSFSLDKEAFLFPDHLRAQGCRTWQYHRPELYCWSCSIPAHSHFFHFHMFPQILWLHPRATSLTCSSLRLPRSPEPRDGSGMCSGRFRDVLPRQSCHLSAPRPPPPRRASGGRRIPAGGKGGRGGIGGIEISSLGGDIDTSPPGWHHTPLKVTS